MESVFTGKTVNERKQTLARRIERFAIPLFVGTVLFALLLGWTLLFSHISKASEDAEAAGLREVQLLADAYASQLFRSLEAIDQLALYIKFGWENTNGRIAPADIVSLGRPKSVSNLFLSIIDDKGNLRSSTIPNPNNVNVKSEPYFIIHRQSNDDLQIGNIRKGNFSDKTIIPFTRRLENNSGQFLGVVLVSVSPEYFTSQYEEQTLGRYGFLGVFNRGGIAQSVRAGGASIAVDKQFTLQPLPIVHPGGATLLAEKKWFADGRSRYIGWRTTDQYQMVAVAGLDRDSYLQPVRDQHARMKRVAMYVTLLVMTIALVVSLLIHRLAAHRDRARQMQLAYRLATEAANEGFFIASAIFSTERQIIDFAITDCNERGANYLGYRKEELIGRTVHSLYGGETFSRTMRMLKKAMKEYHYEAEFDLSLLGVESPRWVHWKILRADGNLAINMRDISAAKAQVAELERLSIEDSLTGLPNRNWINRFLPDAVEGAVQSSTRLAILYIDLDGFKSVNDTSGHAIGDEVLKHAASRLREAVRPHDHVARLGGDEFIVVLKAIAHLDDCRTVAHRILTAFDPSFMTSAGAHQLGASIGIAIAPTHGITASALLRNADQAMYQAKQSGKHTFAFCKDDA